MRGGGGGGGGGGEPGAEVGGGGRRPSSSEMGGMGADGADGTQEDPEAHLPDSLAGEPERVVWSPTISLFLALSTLTLSFILVFVCTNE